MVYFKYACLAPSLMLLIALMHDLQLVCVIMIGQATMSVSSMVLPIGGRVLMIWSILLWDVMMLWSILLWDVLMFWSILLWVVLTLTHVTVAAQAHGWFKVPPPPPSHTHTHTRTHIHPQETHHYMLPFPGGVEVWEETPTMPAFQFLSKILLVSLQHQPAVVSVSVSF